MLEKIQIQLESLKDEMNKMIITDQSGISDKLSYYTPIKLRQEKFLPEIINKLSYSFIGKNLEEGRVSFFRELSKKLASDDFPRLLNSKNIFILEILGQENLLYLQKLLLSYQIRKILKIFIFMM